MPHFTKPGSVADRAMRALADGPMTSRDIAEKLGIEGTSIASSLTRAWHMGVLIRREITVEYARSTVALWALACHAEQLQAFDRPLRIATERGPATEPAKGPSAEGLFWANPFGICA